MVHLFFEGEWVIYFKLYINYNQCLKIQITENIFEKVYGNTILVYSKGFFFFFSHIHGREFSFLKREERMSRNIILVHVSFTGVFSPHGSGVL